MQNTILFLFLCTPTSSTETLSTMISVDDLLFPRKYFTSTTVLVYSHLYNKMENQIYLTVGTVPKSNWKIGKKNKKLITQYHSFSVIKKWTGFVTRFPKLNRQHVGWVPENAIYFGQWQYICILKNYSANGICPLK